MIFSLLGKRPRRSTEGKKTMSERKGAAFTNNYHGVSEVVSNACESVKERSVESSLSSGVSGVMMTNQIPVREENTNSY